MVGCGALEVRSDEGLAGDGDAPGLAYGLKPEERFHRETNQDLQRKIVWNLREGWPLVPSPECRTIFAGDVALARCPICGCQIHSDSSIGGEG
jgi:hypothetical protein